MRKEVWFGLSLMAATVILVFVLMPPPSQMTNGHLGLLMLAMIVVGIMLGFPTAFTLMGMGVIFGWLAYQSGLAHLQLATQSFAGAETWDQLDQMARYAYRSSPRVVARGVLAMLRWDGSNVLPKISVPTLIISGNEEYEVTHLAAEAGVSLNQAYELIRRHGLDRDTLLAAAQALKNAS